MNVKTLAVALGAIVGVSAPAAAQTYTIGANPQGSIFYAAAATIAKVAVEKTGLQFRVAPYSGLLHLYSAGQQWRTRLRHVECRGICFCLWRQGAVQGPHQQEPAQRVGDLRVAQRLRRAQRFADEDGGRSQRQDDSGRSTVPAVSSPTCKARRSPAAGLTSRM